MSKINPVPSLGSWLGMLVNHGRARDHLAESRLRDASMFRSRARGWHDAVDAGRLTNQQVDLLLTLSPAQFAFRVPTAACLQLFRLGLAEHAGWVAWRRTERGQAVRASLGWTLLKGAGQHQPSPTN